jgi:SNF family Na+-dependent transporter
MNILSNIILIIAMMLLLLATLTAFIYLLEIIIQSTLDYETFYLYRTRKRILFEKVLSKLHII